MKPSIRTLWPLAVAIFAVAGSDPARASSHQDAPLITLDPAANTTDVYAFVQGSGAGKVLVTALGVYPHEEPGVGPNKYNFDDDVLYTIHVATGADRTAGRPTFSYEFQFKTSYKSTNTILPSYLNVIQTTNDAGQNLVQTYTVTRVNNLTKQRTVLGTDLVVPPNNQGIATPLYNQGNNGNNPAKAGVANANDLDAYTKSGIQSLSAGYVSFAGQRDDGFYGDINSIFDLLQLRSGAGNGKDSQAGFNIHLIALSIPVSEFGGDQQIVGVYATTARKSFTVLRNTTVTRTVEIVREPGKKPRRTVRTKTDTSNGNTANFVQVARQGNPLFNEALVAIADKDLYNRSNPTVDNTVFRKYAESPELATLINAIVFNGSGPAPETGRTDLAGIFIPDLINVDLSTAAARLAGGGPNHPTTPDDAGFSRLGIFGGDTLTSTVQAGFGNGTVPGGWPNGRRFGDDVIDIAVTAIISDLRTNPPTIRSADGIDGVNANDMVYNKVFPYEATPQNGRNHAH